ncbi:MAG: hypothetical protein RBR54_11165 [Sulfurimonas sp.]|jgi:hypothetical protein|nr:hypothetical protein [Sulfurimonas sp.]
MSQDIDQKGTEIIIDLNETDTKSFKNDRFIQRNAKKEFLILISTFIQPTKDLSCNLNKQSCKLDCHSLGNNIKIDRVHNTILVDGKRGMGKTSFALHIKENIDKNICTLNIIDPTLIETKEHIFLLLITLIKEKVDDCMRCNCCDTNNTDYKNWKEALKKLAGGLSMLDGVGGNHLQTSIWDSPELALEQGLNNSKHGYMLEINFHKYIDESLNVLGKDAFFIVLDDIDTSLDRGMVILEVLRKYLTSPKLIIALLGDIELYATLARQLQWEKIDLKKILKDYELDSNKEKYLSQIEHLEEQYLVKILKPENRIHLKTIYELMNEIEIVPSDPKSPDASLEKYSEAMLKTLFLSTRYKKLFEQTLFTQPTRSVIQLLKAYDKNGHKLTDDFVTTFRDIFYTTLHKKLANYKLLEQGSHALINLLGQYTILNDDILLDTNLEFLPEYGNDDKNIAATYLNLFFNNSIKPKEYLSYFIKVGYALIQAPEKDQIKFINHISLDSSEPNRRIAQRLLTTFDINPNTVSKNFINHGNIFIADFDKTPLAKNKNVAYLVSKVYNPKGGKYSFLSFFNLLGLLADLSFADNDTEIREILKKAQLIRDYRIFNPASNPFEESTREHNDKENRNEEEIKIDDNLVTWALTSKDINPLPIYVLSKIWIRTVYTFIDIESRSENKIKNFADIFELYIAGFLNAVLIQVESFYGNDMLGDKNPSTSTKEYEKNKADYNKRKNIYTLYDFLTACPMLASFESYFADLQKLKFSTPKPIKQKIDKIPWDSITDESKKQLVLSAITQGHQTKQEIARELTKSYKNVTHAKIQEILDPLKQ